MIIYLGVGLAAAWLVACVGLIVFARTLIYPFAPGISAAAPVGIPGAQAKTLVADDGLDVAVWVVPPRGETPVILYFMGNAGSLPSSGPWLAEFAHRGFGSVALNYRGAGGMPSRLNSPRVRLAEAICRSPWKTLIVTAGWLSAAVE